MFAAGARYDYVLVLYAKKMELEFLEWVCTGKPAILSRFAHIVDIQEAHCALVAQTQSVSLLNLCDSVGLSNATSSEKDWHCAGLDARWILIASLYLAALSPIDQGIIKSGGFAKWREVTTPTIPTPDE